MLVEKVSSNELPFKQFIPVLNCIRSAANNRTVAEVR